MTTHTRQEDYGPNHVTFDCPWCGAIAGVDRDRIGEVFQCPECRETTKLTDSNTRATHLSEAPADAPHHEEVDLTFDCPWCGAISPVSALALETEFACPECHNKTRLTDKTTRRSDVFTPAADAPHVHASEGLPGWLFAVLGVVVLAVIAWVAFGTGGESGDEGAGERAAVNPAVSDAAPSPDAAGEQPPDEMATPSQPAAVAVVPDDPADPADDREDPALVAKAAKVAEAKTRVTEAERAYAAADAALQAWLAENEGRLAIAEQRAAGMALTAAIEKEIQILEEEGPTPTAARTANERIAASIAEVPAQIVVAEAVLQTLRAASFRPVRVERWQDLNFLSPGFRLALGDHVQSARLQLPAEHDRLQGQRDDAGVALEEARKALADLQAPSPGE